MKRPLWSFSFAALAAAFTWTASGDDWTRFRGPNGTGVTEAKNLPATFDDTNTTWKVPVARGWSSPVIFGSKVFLTDEAGVGKRSVLCLEAATGRELWHYDVDFTEHRQNSLNSFASASPFVDAQRVYINWTSGNSVEALALDHTGKLLWRNPHVADYIHEHGSAASAVVADGIMVVRAEFDTGKQGQTFATPEQMDWKSCIVGLDVATGKQIWKHEVPNTLNPYSTPVVHDAGGKHEFVLANTTSGYMGIDVASGNLNWQYNPGFKQRSVGSFVLKGDLLYSTLGSGDGGKESALLKLGGPKPEEIGSITKSIPYVPTPLLIEDRLYLVRDGGIISCVKFPTGEEIYNERLPGTGGKGARYFSSPIAADGKIFCASQAGDVVVLKPGDKFEILGVNKLDGAINATPAIAWNHLFVRTDKSLYCIGARTQLP